ncbi:RNA 2'-phosphotransferase [Hyphomicrobium sp. CS1BSMeth3]|uniref:RNA 2'-phosphotransferase n=1 Tax=Hyphomicrobium sp. CS1BSMeth3 TaxID=1892844 RepID=UPI0009315C4E|nr:RNA 2'-phosphotransferase [Hyphomicrobium sp. CS1BSMeth3]
MSKQTSKFLSLVLRHAPERIGLELDAHGWTDIDALIAKANAAGVLLDRAMLLEIVATSDKQRFTLSADGARIRAAQGHSVEIDLDLPTAVPPAVLFHGTARTNVDAILAEGLKPGRRRHVHLSPDVETARRVGMRHGAPVIFEVATARMHADGLVFWQAENGVWLTERVAPAYLTLLG